MAAIIPEKPQLEEIELEDDQITSYLDCPRCGESAFGVYLGKDGKIYLSCDNCERVRGFSAEEGIAGYSAENVQAAMAAGTAGTPI